MSDVVAVVVEVLVRFVAEVVADVSRFVCFVADVVAAEVVRLVCVVAAVHMTVCEVSVCAVTSDAVPCAESEETGIGSVTVFVVELAEAAVVVDADEIPDTDTPECFPVTVVVSTLCAVVSDTEFVVSDVCGLVGGVCTRSLGAFAEQMTPTIRQAAIGRRYRIFVCALCCDVYADTIISSGSWFSRPESSNSFTVIPPFADMYAVSCEYGIMSPEHCSRSSQILLQEQRMIQIPNTCV